MYYYKLSNDIKRNVFTENFEICANMRTQFRTDRRLDLVNIVKGMTIEDLSKNRPTCQIGKSLGYTSIIFHTHPIISYNPPSWEDIRKVFKNDRIRNSVIASTWGLFQISKSNNPSMFSLAAFVDEEPKIKSLIDKLNYMTKDRNVDSPNVQKPWNRLTQKERVYFYQFLTNLNAILLTYNLQVFFTPYNKKNHYPIVV